MSIYHKNAINIKNKYKDNNLLCLFFIFEWINVNYHLAER